MPPSDVRGDDPDARRFCRDHGLSIACAAAWLGLSAACWMVDPDTRAGQLLANHASEAFGAFFLVVLTKKLRERGSAQSK